MEDIEGKHVVRPTIDSCQKVEYELVLNMEPKKGLPSFLTESIQEEEEKY